MVKPNKEVFWIVLLSRSATLDGISIAINTGQLVAIHTMLYLLTCDEYQSVKIVKMQL